jgi:(1->4)-alpha-D-glucan 1-alpha-D-glucosylmutase
VLPRDPEDTAAQRGHDRRAGYPPADASEAAERLRFAMKFQQYTGPLQAKGLEDTAFYRYNLLLSLNDVGGDPSKFGSSAEEFHELSLRRRHEWPYEMLATATHDTKVGEDVRTRIDVLSELPEEWGREVSRWMRINRTERVIVDGDPAPDRNDEYRLYQALLGVWPPEVSTPEASPELIVRLQGYMTKSMKEAKLHTSWINPNEPYEQAVNTFVERVLSGAGGARFLPAFLPFAQRVARIGLVNSLSQVALKLASPGVPDVYQGTELWDFSLVDPDNRRPVDFETRQRALNEASAVLALPPAQRGAAIAQLLDGWTDGTIKLLVTTAALRLRRDAAELFLEGDYVPLEVDSSVAAGVIAFARVLGDRALIVVAPHLVSGLIDNEHPVPLGDRWKTSRVRLPPELATRTFHDVLTRSELSPVTTGNGSWLFVGQVLEHLPVALLLAEART